MHIQAGCAPDQLHCAFPTAAASRAAFGAHPLPAAHLLTDTGSLILTKSHPLPSSGAGEVEEGNTTGIVTTTNEMLNEPDIYQATATPAEGPPAPGASPLAAGNGTQPSTSNRTTPGTATNSTVSE